MCGLGKSGRVNNLPVIVFNKQITLHTTLGDLVGVVVNTMKSGSTVSAYIMRVVSLGGEVYGNDDFAIIDPQGHFTISALADDPANVDY